MELFSNVADMSVDGCDNESEPPTPTINPACPIPFQSQNSFGKCLSVFLS